MVLRFASLRPKEYYHSKVLYCVVRAKPVDFTAVYNYLSVHLKMYQYGNIEWKAYPRSLYILRVNTLSQSVAL